MNAGTLVGCCLISFIVGFVAAIQESTTRNDMDTLQILEIRRVVKEECDRDRK